MLTLSLCVSTKPFFLPTLNRTRPLATRLRLTDHLHHCLLDVLIAPLPSSSAAPEANASGKEGSGECTAEKVQHSLCEVKKRVIKEVLSQAKVLVGHRVWESLAALNINGMKRLPEALQVVELGEPNYVGRSCYYYQGLNGGEGAAVDRMVRNHAHLIYSLQVIECQEQMERYLNMVNRDK